MSPPDDAAQDGSTQVDAFLKELPEDQRSALNHLREVIAAVAPTATQGISYGVPTFKLDERPLVSFGAGKHHCAFYLMSTEVMETQASDLDGYDLGKGSIRFKPDASLPDTLVRKLVKARVVEIEERRS